MKHIYLFLLIFLIACNASQHCIKVGGEYQGIEGDIEYCYSPEKSKQNEIPTIVDPKGNASYILSEQDIADIAALTKNTVDTVSAKVKPSATPEKPTSRAVKFILSRRQ